jgi:hypothetical protein
MRLRDLWRTLTRRRDHDDDEPDTRQARDNRSDVPEVSKWVPRSTDQEKPQY